METLNRAVNIYDFFSKLKTSSTKVLFLDYDGTLAPFNKNRDEAYPYEGVNKLLSKIMGIKSCRLVLVTGRWTKDILKLLKLKRMPEIWGSHGWERLLPDNTYNVEKIGVDLLSALTSVEDWIRAEGMEALSEMKPACIALHWRGKSEGEISGIVEKVKQNWSLIPGHEHLLLSGFDGGLEFRVPGRNKGYAVEKVLSESGSNTVAAYLGDDITDEDAFKSISGRGLSVLVRDKMRATCADLWIEPPDEMIAFLKEWISVCDNGR